MNKKNLFLNKTDDELIQLYEQFLDFEKTGVIYGNELATIRDEYLKTYGSGGAVTMVEFDVLHTIADRWYKPLIEKYNKI